MRLRLEAAVTPCDESGGTPELRLLRQAPAVAAGRDTSNRENLALLHRKKDVRACPQSRIKSMPDVGLFTAAKPLDSDYKVIIKFAVEVEGLPVYQESYDVKTLEQEWETDPERLIATWMRRIKCTVHCRKRPGFSACLTRCLMDGQCGDLGHAKLHALDSAGQER
jgi:hypothetical protein